MDGGLSVVSVAFNKLIRAKDRPFVSVELDDAAEAGFSFLMTGMAVIAGVATALGLIGGRHVVRVSINTGPRLETISHRYKDRNKALEVAERLVSEIASVGLSAVDDWNDDPGHWGPS